MEEIARCLRCAWVESWDTPTAARAAAVWHVYEEHRLVWVELIGDRPPRDPRPQELGTRFEEWERQWT